MTNRFATAQSNETLRPWGDPGILTLMATVALTMLTTAPPADAVTRQTRPERTTEAVAQRDAGLAVRSKSRLLDDEHIASGGQAEEVILSAIVRGRNESRGSSLFFSLSTRF